jgi:hypothetical protein
MRHKLTTFAGLLASSLAWAQYVCEGEPPVRAKTTRVRLAEPMPVTWFQINGRSIEDPVLHRTMEDAWENGRVTETGVEKSALAFLCLRMDSFYLVMRTDGVFGNASYSSEEPYCVVCSDSRGLSQKFSSGSGLRLGMTKAEVSSLLSTQVQADNLEISFETQLAEGGSSALRIDTLGLTFDHDRLVEYGVRVYRE